MRITLKQMVVFEAVARLGSIGQAANEIALSQSATSMSLQDLERNLGVPLFHRNKKKLTLNENGRRLHPKARALIMQAQDIESVPNTEQLQGQLKIGASTTIGQYVVPRFCRDFLRLYPNITLKLTVAPVQDILDKVDSLAIDVGLIESPINRASLTVVRLGSDPLTLFASPEHRLARKKRVTIDDLEGQTWYLPAISSISRQALTLGLGEGLGPMKIAFESDVIEAVKQAVKGSNALSCLSFLALESEFASGTLTEVKVEDLNLTRPFNMIYRTDVFQGALQRAFADFVAKEMPQTLISQA